MSAARQLRSACYFGGCHNLDIPKPCIDQKVAQLIPVEAEVKHAGVALMKPSVVRVRSVMQRRPPGRDMRRIATEGQEYP